MKQTSKPPATFEAALQELERLVQTLEGGGASLEQSIEAYERGMILLKHCQDTLGQVEQKIRMLDQDALRDLPAPATEEGSGS
ncbi:MAG: exodeoxyribonuclease VII small subunit [Pseudomonadota bacterium]